MHPTRSYSTEFLSFLIVNIVMFLTITRSGLRLIKLLLGGQTITLGKAMSEMESLQELLHTVHRDGFEFTEL